MTLDTLKESHKSLTESANAAYKSCVIAAAKDEPGNDLETIHACASIGKTIADFERDVEHVRTRLLAAANIAEAATLESDLPALNEAAREAREHYESVRAECAQKTEEAADSYRTARQAADSKGGKIRSLRTVATDLLRASAAPSIQEEIDRRRNRIVDLQNQVNAQHKPFSDPEPRAASDAKALEEIKRLDSEISQLEARRLDPILGAGL